MRLQFTEAQSVVRPSWPDAVAFREAIQNPQSTLGDPELQAAQVVLDRRGLPLAYSGRFAVVFRLRTPGGDWAIRCFTQASNDGERRERYRALSATLADAPGPFVPFRYIERGIRVGVDWFPVVGMRWAEGETLGRWIEKNLRDPAALRRLGATLSRLLDDLEAAGIAHGDWQHDNLLVSPDGEHVTLVDYDGMFVPALAGLPALELGHPNYQHPDRSREDFAGGLDRFSCLVLQTALRALACDPALWTRFSDGESFLFKRADFEEPERSPVFEAVKNLAGEDPELDACLARLEAECLKEGPSGVFVRAQSAPGAPAKWWLAPETVSTAQRRPRPKVVTEWKITPAPPREAVYAARLRSREYVDIESGNLGTARLCTALLLLSPLLLWGFFPIAALAFGGLLMALTLCYLAWPRKALSDELSSKAGQIRNQLYERYHALAQEHLLAALSHADPQASRLDAFVAARLKSTPIEQALYLPGIGPETLQQLEAAGVFTLADLGSPTKVPAVPPHEMTSLLAWRKKRESEAAGEYQQAARGKGQRSRAAARLLTTGTLAQQQQNAVDCERALADLHRERTAFPTASVWAYLGRIFGSR